jgi:predicted patatin/cPLA2 family phospholipase
MDIIKTYIANISTNVKTSVVDNYKIITVNDKSSRDVFLIYDPENSTLGSKTLMKLLMIGTPHPDMLLRLTNSDTEPMKRYANKLSEISSILYEDRIFFNFDPYGNFLLANNVKSKDIKRIIAKTTSYQPTPVPNLHKDNDFSRMVNPYGLEKVVFTGGGTKGIVYVGALLGLIATGQIFYLNHFAGTSVGALTAMVLGCVTPTAQEYGIMRKMSLRDIMTRKQQVIERYQEAMTFIIERFCQRDIKTFYTLPTYSFYGIWTALDTIMKNNGLYDPQKSGFQIWYALICKKICQIMRNGLDCLIIIKKKDGTLVEFPSMDKNIQKNNDCVEEKDGDGKSEKEIDVLYNFDTDQFEGWELVKFFTFQEYHDNTYKTLVLTGTQTKRIGTVYYTHTSNDYKDLNVMTGAMASMSIPWIFKAQVINDSYNLDGGIYDNYPLTHCDKKIKDKITHYNNKIFGYLIDDKNTVIDAYEIIRELWIVYVGFIEVVNISYLKDSLNYAEICELFFEIRAEVYKLLYFTDVDLETFLSRDINRELVSGFNIRDLEDIFRSLLADSEYIGIGIELPEKGIGFIESHLRRLDTSFRNFDSLFKIGRKTDLADVMELSVRQGEAYNSLSQWIDKDLHEIKKMEIKTETITRYEDILKHLMGDILAYYELKGTFINTNDLEYPSRFFVEIMKSLYKKLETFEKMTNEAMEGINKKDPLSKNHINNHIQVAMTMISKILTRGSGNNVDLTDIELKKDRSTYQKALDFFFHTDMTGIMYKYMCIANDRICNDSFNRMRTIKINTFEASVLHFDMDDDLKFRLIYEGYSKTVKYFTNLLHIMEITEMSRPDDEYLESFELRYKKMI